MPKLHLARFRSSVESAADAWPERRARTARPDTDHMRYLEASNLLITDVKRGNPIIGNEIVREPSTFGIQLLFRTCHIAALLAAKTELTKEQLVASLHGPQTLGQLANLMTKTPLVAERVEEKIGLTPLESQAPDITLAWWSLSENGLINRQFEQELTDATLRHNPLNKKGECPIHAVGFTKPLLSAVVRICDKDQNLFERSIADDSAHAR